VGSAVSHQEIRRLTQSDIDDLVELESANRANPWTSGVFADEIAANNRIYMAILDGDQLLAYGGVMVIGDEAHVLNLLVAPDQRRKGHGRRLMIALVDEAVEAGAKHLTLEVRSRNAAAIDLYRRFGLAPVGVRPDYYGDDDAMIMWAHAIDGPEYMARLEGLR
jgi:[ribosomal protein S18]-alanine N-acetyltransferase